MHIPIKVEYAKRQRRAPRYFTRRTIAAHRPSYQKTTAIIGSLALAHSPKLCKQLFRSSSSSSSSFLPPLSSFLFFPPPSLLSRLPAPSFSSLFLLSSLLRSHSPLPSLPPSFLLSPPVLGSLEDAGLEAVLAEVREPDRASHDIWRIAGA